eukprot:CAMPEP_0202073826 /NCGR_PEP_ID=MMETSP0964-20121228/3258_1 /ASSEMBLY_ACC=CAM_ASM_000500 /TAXON_ID=4773 /ORGANISM="Schizochytrium aggregatum, Strain ATCC28209" /LENGTH=142 /DNA_ID=CAMNT_0048640951 /DNA_START=496 /DNA_END=921 /DNA_ORIENTATION=-
MYERRTQKPFRASSLAWATNASISTGSLRLVKAYGAMNGALYFEPIEDGKDCRSDGWRYKAGIAAVLRVGKRAVDCLGGIWMDGMEMFRITLSRSVNAACPDPPPGSQIQPLAMLELAATAMPEAASTASQTGRPRHGAAAR